VLDLLILGAVALVLLSKPQPPVPITPTSADVPRKVSPYPLPPGGLSTGGGTESVFGAYAPVAEKVVAGLTNIIEAARATDDGSGDPQ
jgi:hypothetical protein